MKYVYNLKSLRRHEPASDLGTGATLAEVLRYLEANRARHAHELADDPNKNGNGIIVEKIAVGVFDDSRVVMQYNWKGVPVVDYDGLGRVKGR
jgi:hypothetical protein